MDEKRAVETSGTEIDRAFCIWYNKLQNPTRSDA